MTSQYTQMTPIQLQMWFSLGLLQRSVLDDILKTIYKRIGFSTTNILQYFICERCREHVMDASRIETLQVDIDANVPCFLGLHHHETNPI
jgi:hypothetical protein